MDNEKKKAKKSGGKRSLLTLLLMIFAIAACAISGYLLWELKFAPARTDAVAATGETAPEPVKPVDPLYVSMNTFTVSLKPTANESDRVLFLGLSIRLADKSSVSILEKYLPEYRSRLFMLLTQQTYESLSTDAGKTQLIESIKNELSKPLEANLAIVPSDVLINEFILR
ncbi:flagellar basal body-associated FliL family protein [Pantoea sp.]|uniref:flagellar basal body-associated FliL family protein n=1 Tax=Pantoea sp. TaxID=69393 RepID=UPI0031DCD150